MGNFAKEVNEIIFDGRLIGLTKKDSRIRPITAGYILRRLAAKCANRHVIERRSADLQPIQLGMEVPGVAEAAIHAMHRCIEAMLSDYVTINLDFTNAFNTVRRDLILDNVAANTPEIYRFTFTIYTCEPQLAYEPYLIRFKEGSQQSNALSSLEFCDATQSTLKSLKSELRSSFIIDITLSGYISTVASDIEKIVAAATETDLQLNPTECKIFYQNIDTISHYKIFYQFKRINCKDMMLL